MGPRAFAALERIDAPEAQSCPLGELLLRETGTKSVPSEQLAEPGGLSIHGLCLKACWPGRTRRSDHPAWLGGLMVLQKARYLSRVPRNRAHGCAYP